MDELYSDALREKFGSMLQPAEPIQARLRGHSVGDASLPESWAALKARLTVRG